MTAPTSTPKRKSRRWIVPVIALALTLVGLALAIPGSPVHLAKLLEPEQRHDNLTSGEWLAALAQGDAARRVEAAIALGKLTSRSQYTLPKLVETMRRDEDADVRAAASDAVGKLFPVDADEGKKKSYGTVVIEATIAGLTDPDLRVRHNAALTLAKLKVHAKPAVPALISACTNPQNDTNLNIYQSTVQQVMLRALGEAASGTPEAVPTFRALLDLTPPEKPKSGAGRGQGELTAEESAAWNKYICWLGNRRIAVAGLGLAGEHGRPHAAKVRELLTSKDENDRFEATLALQRMGLPANGG